LEAKAV
jgi:hypothetical protein